MKSRAFRWATIAGATVAALLIATAAQARTCAQVQTDLNAQYKARAMYDRELRVERNPARRDQLIRGIQNFDRNIAILRAERCDQGAQPPQRAFPPAVGPVIRPPVVRTPPPSAIRPPPPPVRTSPGNCVVNLEGECVR